MQELLALLSGVLVGFSLGLVGGGGSILAVPLMVYVVGVPNAHVAIGTSAVAVAVNAAVNLSGHARRGNVLWSCALPFAAAGVAGAFIGSILGKMLDGHKLLALFALLMLVIAGLMLRSRGRVGDGDVRLNRSNLPALLGLGLGTGTLSGFFGIGGGFLIVPGLMAATGMTLANAAASSLVSVSLFGAATSLNYAASGLVNWSIAGLFILGGLAGGLAGVRGASLLAGRALLARRMFAGLVLAVAAFVLVHLVHRALATAGLYRLVWHPALFDVCLFVIFLGGLTALSERLLS